MNNYISILLLVIQAIAWRLPFADAFLMSDAAIRAYVSLEILDGSLPYRDIFNNKPPVILYFGAIFSKLAKDPALGYWLMEATFVVIAATVIFWMVRKFSDPSTALVFGSLFILLSNVSFFHYFTPGFIEYPAATFTTLAYFLTLYGQRPIMHTVAGVFLVSTMLSQQIAVIACIPIWLWLGFYRRYRDLSAHLIGVALSLGVVLLWLYRNGALNDFLYQVFTFGYFYFKAHPTEIAEFRLPYLYYLFIPVPFLLLSINYLLRQKGDSLLIILWLLFAAAALLLTGLRLYAHYFVILAAPMTLALAKSWIVTRENLSENVRFALAGLFILIFTGMTLYSSRDYIDRVGKRALNASTSNLENTNLELALYLNKYPLEQRRVVLYLGFANPAVVALMTNTKMPKPFAYFGDFFDLPHHRKFEMTQKWIIEIKKNIPTLVVEDKRRFYPVPLELSDWIAKNYELVHDAGEFRVLARYDRQEFNRSVPHDQTEK